MNPEFRSSEARPQKDEIVLIKKCHMCGEMIESQSEVQRCPSCNKSFLPLNYFSKVHDVKTADDFRQLFENSDLLCEDELIKGLYVLW